MCVAPSVNGNLYDTLLEENRTWLEHYDPVKCLQKSIFPTMEFVPFIGTNNYNADLDNIDMEVDATKKFKPTRRNVMTYDTIAGVYTMYPYIKIPDQVSVTFLYCLLYFVLLILFPFCRFRRIFHQTLQFNPTSSNCFLCSCNIIRILITTSR